MGHYAHRSVRKCRRRHRSAEEDEEEKTLNFVEVPTKAPDSVKSIVDFDRKFHEILAKLSLS